MTETTWVISLSAVKKNPTPFHVKSLGEARGMKYLNIIKVLYSKPIASTILNGEHPKAFPLRLRT